LNYTAPFFGKNYSRIYLFLVKYAPLLWGFGYYFLNLDWVDRVSKVVRRINNRIYCRGLEEYLLAQQPDLVLTTHFLPNEVISHLKKRHGFKTFLVTCITDYYPHAFWRDQGVDFFVTPSEQLTPRLVRLQIAAERIKPLGIPIDPVFGQRKSKEAVRVELGLAPDRFTVLITSGGFGVGPVQKLLREIVQIAKPLQTLVICGNNSKLRESLAAAYNDCLDHRVHVYGYVRNMHELMDASDLMVSKSGGLTVTEAMAKGLPMIVLDPIPGQESGNCDFLLKHHAGLQAKNSQAAAGTIARLAAEPELLRQLRDNIARLGRPQAAREIMSYVQTVFGQGSKT
jgi:processive 1,2-diacylglycerol beta-glucosyltransferase